MNELLYCLWLSGIKGIGCERAMDIYEKFGSFEAVYNADKPALCGIHGIKDSMIDEIMKKDTSGAYNIMEKCEKEDIRIIPVFDENFPERLKHISSPPIILYTKGAEVNFNEIAPVTIVGSRRPSDYGCKMSFKIGYELAQAGAVVVSGMARGVDSLSQRGAIKAGGITVAVLGTGCETAYPAENRDLKELIENNGCVISEYSPGMMALPSNFPRRNRIMSGLSAAVVFIEGEKNSGTLITARCALEQGRDVFCLPGNIDNPLSYAPNMLMKEGAYVMTDPSDVIDALNREYDTELLESAAETHMENAAALLPPEQKEIVSLLSRKTPVHIDDICGGCSLDTARITQNLMLLEIGGMVKSMPGRYYLLK